MIEKYSHYLMFSDSRPACADEGGCVKWREGFEKLDKKEWTEAEKWLFSMEKSMQLQRTLKALAEKSKKGQEK